MRSAHAAQWAALIDTLRIALGSRFQHPPSPGYSLGYSLATSSSRA